MGICSSCLGLDRHNSHSEPSDTSQLLGEQYLPHYGTSITPGIPQSDPEEIRRQRDALERLCAQTSDNLIDVSRPLHHVAANEPPSGRPAIPYDFPRLFADHFAQLTSATPPRSASIDRHPYSSQNSSRPGSSRAITEEDENVWLTKVLPKDASTVEAAPSWEKVNGSWQGKLTWDFDMVMGGGEGSRHAVSAA